MLISEFQIKDKLVERLSLMYGRPNTFRWTYEEFCLLADIARRPDVDAELESLEAFKLKGKWFPQSLGSLLRGWNDICDRARGCATKTPAIRAMPPPALKGKEMSAEEYKRFGEQLQQHRKALT